MKGGLPQELLKMTSLKTLDLSFNALKDVDGVIDAMPCLVRLDVSHNRLPQSSLDRIGTDGNSICQVVNTTTVRRVNSRVRRGLDVEGWPALEDQFKPLSTPILRERLVRCFRIHTHASLSREAILRILCQATNFSGGRTTRKLEGARLPRRLLDPLLAQLRVTEWPCDSESAV